MAYLWTSGNANMHMAIGWFGKSNLPHDVQLVAVMLDRLLSYMPPGTFKTGRARCPPPPTDGYYSTAVERAIVAFQSAWNARLGKTVMITKQRVTVGGDVDPSTMVASISHIYTIVALNLAFTHWYGSPFSTYVKEQEWSVPDPLLSVLKMLAPVPDFT
jgi:hypothetical protein